MRQESYHRNGPHRRKRRFAAPSTIAFSLLLVLLLFTDGCAGSQTTRQRGRRLQTTGQQQHPKQERNRQQPGGQPDDWGDEEGSGESSGGGQPDVILPQLDYNSRTANPNVQPATGAGDSTAFRGKVVVIEVDTDGPQASDSNSGAPGQPVKTVARAFVLVKQHANEPVFIDLRIHAGVYREQLQLSTGKNSPAHLLIEGIGDVVLSGSERYDGWQPTDDGKFTHPWSHDWGVFTDSDKWRKFSARMKQKHRDWIESAGDLFKRQEIVVVNGEVMRQVLSESELKAGSFYVDEPGDKLILEAPAGVSLDRAEVEVGERWQILDLQQCPNLTMRNLTFTHAATMVEQRAVWIRGCDNLLLENCSFSQNNFRGLGLYGSDHASLRHCTANSNGAQGIDMAFIYNLLLEDCVTDSNNWRGDWANTYAWAIAGVKILLTANTIVRNHQANDNLTFGVWFDHDNLQVLVENSTMKRNKVDGLFLEATRGPIRVRNCTIEDNTWGGVRIANAERITLEQNRIADNRKTQIYMRGYGRMVDTRVTGRVEKMEYRQITLTRNTIIADSKDELLFWTNLNQQQLKPFVESVDSDYNSWVHPTPDACMQIAGSKQRFGFDTWKDMVEGGHSTIRAEQ